MLHDAFRPCELTDWSSEIASFNTASALHENFYENDMETDDVADGLDDVEALMDELIPLLSQT